MNPHTIESLRLTMQHLEQTKGPTVVPEDLAALQRVLLRRIAELDATPAPEAAAPDRIDRLDLL